jgi:hypothetical protein
VEIFYISLGVPADGDILTISYVGQPMASFDKHYER